MKPLKFDRKTARELYLRDNPDFQYDPRRLELILFRMEFLSRNPVFIKEYHQAKGNRALKLEFSKRWDVSIDGMAAFRRPDPAAVVVDADRRGSNLVVKVDLRHTKKEILHELEILVSKYKKMLDEDYIRDSFDEYDPECTAPNRDPIRRVGGNIPSDLELWEKYLMAWHHKHVDGLTLQESAKLLGVSIDNIRDWRDRAEKLIKEGVPGFKCFPKE